jgi:hypothetical protein
MTKLSSTSANLIFSYFNQNLNVPTILVKIPNMNFHRNSRGGSHIVPCRERQTGLTKPVFNYSLCKLSWKRWTASSVDLPCAMYTGPTRLLLADWQKDTHQTFLEQYIKMSKSFHFLKAEIFSVVAVWLLPSRPLGRDVLQQYTGV